MGGLNPGIPLAVRPPSEPQGPLDMAGGAMQLSALAQQQQVRQQQLQMGQQKLQEGEIQLQQARQSQVSQEMLQRIYQKNQGDLDATYKEAAASGKVIPEHLIAIQKHNLDIQTQVAGLDKDKLAAEIASGNEFMGILQTAKTLPEDQRMDYAKSQVSQRATRMDMSGAAKILAGLPNLKDKTIDGLAPTLIGYNKYVEQQHQKLEDEAKALTAKAAQTRAETEKQPTEASLALASAQGDAISEAALKRLDQSKLASRPPRDTSASTNSRSDKSYRYSSAQLDKVGQPIEQAIQRFGRLKDTINQETPQADALVAPELLTVMAGGQGSGLRMNEAEIKRIVGGRSNLESLKAALNKWQLDPSKALSITSAQRQQVRDLMNEVQGKLLRKQEALDQARQDLVHEDDVFKQRMIVTGARNKLTKIDMGEDSGGESNAPPPGSKVRDYTSLGKP